MFRAHLWPAKHSPRAIGTFYNRRLKTRSRKGLPQGRKSPTYTAGTQDSRKRHCFCCDCLQKSPSIPLRSWEKYTISHTPLPVSNSSPAISRRVHRREAHLAGASLCDQLPHGSQVLKIHSASSMTMSKNKAQACPQSATARTVSWMLSEQFRFIRSPSGLWDLPTSTSEPAPVPRPLRTTGPSKEPKPSHREGQSSRHLAVLRVMMSQGAATMLMVHQSG